MRKSPPSNAARRASEALELVGLGRLRRALPAPALRRPAAARRPGPRAGDAPRMLLLDEPLSALDAKCASRCATRSAASRPPWHHHPVRDARPGGGARRRRPHRRDERGRHRADRHARGDLPHPDVGFVGGLRRPQRTGCRATSSAATSRVRLQAAGPTPRPPTVRCSPTSGPRTSPSPPRASPAPSSPRASSALIRRTTVRLDDDTVVTVQHEV